MIAPAPMSPWTDPEIVDGLNAGWTSDPRNIADAERLVVAALAECPQPTSVLDYGCGTGRLASLVASVAPRNAYLGYDTSRAMLSVARRENPGHRFTNRLAAGRKFDLVLCNGVMQYQPDRLWGEVLRDVVGRARSAALIETYDGSHADPAVTGNGSGATIFRRAASEYIAVMKEFGTVERRLLAAGRHGSCDLALYVVRL